MNIKFAFLDDCAYSDFAIGMDISGQKVIRFYPSKKDYDFNGWYTSWGIINDELIRYNDARKEIENKWKLTPNQIKSFNENFWKLGVYDVDDLVRKVTGMSKRLYQKTLK